MGDLVDLKPEKPEVDAGWVAAAFAINEIGSSIGGGDFEVYAIPDPDGVNPKGKPGIYLSITSLELEDVGAQMIIPYKTETITSMRMVLVSVFAQLYGQIQEERDTQESTSKLIVPSLIVPGRDK